MELFPQQCAHFNVGRHKRGPPIHGMFTYATRRLTQNLYPHQKLQLLKSIVKYNVKHINVFMRTD